MNQQNIEIENDNESKYNFFKKKEINILDTFNFNVFINICLVIVFFSIIGQGFDILNHKTSIEHNKELLSIIGIGSLKFILAISYVSGILHYTKSCLMLKTKTVKNLSGGLILLICSIFMINLPNLINMMFTTLK